MKDTLELSTTRMERDFVSAHHEPKDVHIDADNTPDFAAPRIAKDYWSLPEDATLRDVVVVIRADEAHHRGTNHDFAYRIAAGEHV